MRQYQVDALWGYFPHEHHWFGGRDPEPYKASSSAVGSALPARPEQPTLSREGTAVTARPGCNQDELSPSHRGDLNTGKILPTAQVAWKRMFNIGVSLGLTPSSTAAPKPSVRAKAGKPLRCPSLRGKDADIHFGSGRVQSCRRSFGPCPKFGGSTRCATRGGLNTAQETAAAEPRGRHC